MEYHPLDAQRFLVASEDGNTRLFDMRMIRDYDPVRSAVNTYRNLDLDVPPQYARHGDGALLGGVRPWGEGASVWGRS